MAQENSILMNDSGFNAMLAGNPSSKEDAGKPISDSEYRKEIKGTIDETKKAEKEIDDLPTSKPPTLTQAPKESDFQTDPMKKFGSAGMMLATLGSLLTRKPLTNALNSGAQVMNAINTNDAVAFKTAYEKWKSDNDNAWKMADWEQSHLKELSDKAKNKIQGADQEARLWGVATKNPALERAAQMGELQQYADAHAKATREGKDAQEKVNLKHDLLVGGIDEFKAQNGRDPNTQEMAKIRLMADKQVESKTVPGGAGATLSQDALDEITEEYLGGNRNVVSGLGYGQAGAANRSALRENIAKSMKDKGMNGKDIDTAMAEYQGMVSGERTIAQRGANVGMFSNEAKNMAEILRDASKNLKRSSFVPLANGQIAVDVSTNDPEADQYNAAINTYINAYAKAVNGGGTALLADKEHARDVIFKGMDDNAINKTLDILDKEMDSAIAAPRQAKDNLAGRKSGLAGKPPDDKHIKMLKDDPSKENRDYFDEAFGEGSAEKILGK